MGNITDDIRQHFDTFAELPFTEADSLALSQLAYARMPDNVPRYHENAETADGMIATVQFTICCVPNAMTTCSARCGRLR